MNGGEGRRYVKHKWLKPDSVEDRRYQRKIMETARRKNTLVVLPTALGKTVIALLLAVDRVQDGKVFFLAPTRPLVQQHRQTFLDKTLFDDQELVMATGRYPPQKRSFLYRSGRIIFATPQSVRNDLKNKLVSVEDASLMVFDEAHRARGRYAYVTVARHYFQQCPQPLVLGLTASPGGYEEKIMDVCRNLRVEAIQYRTEEDEDVKPYIQPIDVAWNRVKLPEVYLQVRDKLKEMMIKRVKGLQTLGALSGKPPSAISRRDLVELNRQLKQRITDGEGGHVYRLKVEATATLSIMHMIALIETQGAKVLHAFVERSLKPKAFHGSRGHRSIMKDHLFRQVEQKLRRCLTVDNPKMTQLREILTREIEASGDSRFIIFTQYRDTVQSILKTLQTVSNVRGERFVGQSDRKGDPGMSQEQQSAALQRLRNGEVNVLVATRIAEEGLDIPEVDHVIFYEPVPSEIRYIQRRGRTGRRVAGQVTILIAENTLDEAFYWASKKRTEKMRRMIKKLNQKLPAMLQESLKSPRTSTGFKRHKTQMETEQFEVGRKKVDRYELWKPQYFQTKGLSPAVKWLLANIPEETTSVTDMVQKAVEEAGINRPVIETAIWRLIQQGRLYQPEPGKIKRP